jgi:hypothetical protein
MMKMRIPTQSLLVALLSILLLVPAARAFAQGVVWRSSTLDEALAEAASSERTLMIDVRANHCGQCIVFETEFWNTPAGAEFADGMIPLKIDSTTPAGAELSKRYPVTGLPCVIFVRPDGTEIDRVVGYETKQKFLDEAQQLKNGIDPLPGMEKALAANPDALALMLPILDRYLYRWREAEAMTMLQRILAHDPENRGTQAERALTKVAKYYELVHVDPKIQMDNYKMLLDRFPACSSAGAAVEGSYKAALRLGTTKDWIPWICKILEGQSTNGRLQYASAMTASRYGIIDPCFAKAARQARALGVGGAFLDTLAVKLEGGTMPPGKPAPAHK